MFENNRGKKLNLKTGKHAKPIAEKIFSYLREIDEELELAVLQKYLEELVGNKYLHIKGINGSETFTIVKNVTPPNGKQPSPTT